LKVRSGKLNGNKHVNSRHITAVLRDWGFRLNLKMVLYLENLCLMEKTRIFIPQPRKAPRRYVIAMRKSDVITTFKGF
jgi:hypothetical protein